MVAFLSYLIDPNDHLYCMLRGVSNEYKTFDILYMHIGFITKNWGLNQMDLVA